MKKRASEAVHTTQTIENYIFHIRGHRVLFDSDLAELYGVSTKRVNEQIKRNKERFPEDFAFQLTSRELKVIRSQIATTSLQTPNLRSHFATSSSHGGRRYLPYVFTEHGALMTANVLNSKQAVTMSIYVIRAFVRMRYVFTINQILEERLVEIEKVLLNHDVALEELFEKIKLLLLPPKTADAIGFDFSTPRPGKIV